MDAATIPPSYACSGVNELRDIEQRTRRACGVANPAPETLLGLSESATPIRVTSEDAKRIGEHEELAARDPQAYIDACRTGKL